jgi:hypothetical protein
LLTSKKRFLPDWFNQSPGSQTIQWDKKPDGTLTPKVVSAVFRYPRLNGFPVGSQVTTSETHPDWGRRFRKGQAIPGDVGGKFQSQKLGVVVEFPQVQRLYGETFIPRDNLWNCAEYRGPIYAVQPNNIQIPTGSLRDLRPFGTTAIARCKPTNSIADSALFLAELYSEGLPKLVGATLWKENVSLARSAGEEYLNQEFGWKPLISDVRDILHAVTHAHTVLSQYERDSGKMVRRRYSFPEENSTVTTQPTTSQGFIPVSTGPILISGPTVPGKVYKTTTTWRHVWFSGAFTYYLPTGYRSRNALIDNAHKARQLLGLDLTPEVLWNAAPWSWAIDWFSNAGDVISNLSDWSTDGMVLRYGYVMEHSYITDRYVVDDSIQRFKSDCVFSPITSFVETKRREVATPFGFSMDWSGLSLRQLSIASALGLTHGKGK